MTTPHLIPPFRSYILAKIFSILSIISWGVILIIPFSTSKGLPDGGAPILVWFLLLPLLIHSILTLFLFLRIRWTILLFIIIVVPQIALFGTLSVYFFQDCLKGKFTDRIDPRLYFTLYTLFTLLLISLLISLNKCYHALTNTTLIRGFDPILKPADPPSSSSHVR